MKGIPGEDLEIAKSVLKTLIYFDIFAHPLLSEEILKYCSYPKIRAEDCNEVLSYLKNNNLLSFHEGFYYLGNDISKVKNRIEYNRLASVRMRTARRYAGLISNFPYVRAVFISGSLSKHVMKPDSDIDFFIITKPNRLWICRAFLTFYKKVFLGNSNYNFCINYYIDSESLEISDKNIFTATEIAFLLPMYNYKLYREFMTANQWYRSDYPNIAEREEENKIKSLYFKNVLEFLLNNPIGNWLDHKSFYVFTAFWKKKFRTYTTESFLLNFRSGKNISKHHPNAFQEVVVNKYKEKINIFEKSTGLILQ
jgi:hypothetical protein